MRVRDSPHRVHTAGERVLLDVFQVVVVEYNVEPLVLRDGNGSVLSVPHPHRRGTGRRRPTGDSGSAAHRCHILCDIGGKGVNETSASASAALAATAHRCCRRLSAPLAW